MAANLGYVSLYREILKYVNFNIQYKEEILNSLKDLQNVTIPGTDGQPAGFYNVFWIDIITFYLTVLTMLLKTMNYLLNVKGNY